MSSLLSIVAAITYLAALCRADWLQDLQSGRSVALAAGVRLRLDHNPDADNPASYFESHLLRVDLDEVAGISVAKAKGREGLQIGLYESFGTGSGQARGEVSVAKVFFPLLLGFKVAGTILTTLVAVIVVSLKAFLVSKVALLLSGSVALKKLFSHDPPEIAHYPVDVHPQYYEAYDYPPEPDYDAHATDPTGPYEPSSHEAADSNISQQYVKAASGSQSPATGNVSAAPLRQPTGIKRRVFVRKQPPVPVLTVHKITTHESDGQL